MANEQKAVFRISLGMQGITIGGVDNTVLYEGGNSFQLTVPASSTNFQIDFACVVSKSLAQGIVADKDCTVKTNSTSSPGQTIALKANQALTWGNGEPTASKVFTTDVTGLYVTTTVDTLLKVAVGQDATP